MQMVVSGIAWLMQFTMETTAIESLNAACNIFIGMVCLSQYIADDIFLNMKLIELINLRQVFHNSSLRLSVTAQWEGDAELDRCYRFSFSYLLTIKNNNSKDIVLLTEQPLMFVWSRFSGVLVSSVSFAVAGLHGVVNRGLSRPCFSLTSYKKNQLITGKLVNYVISANEMCMNSLYVHFVIFIGPKRARIVSTQ